MKIKFQILIFFVAHLSFLSKSQTNFKQELKTYIQKFNSIKSFKTSVDTNNISFKLSYHAPEIESFKFSGYDSTSFKQQLKLKEDYHFFEVSFTDLNKSLTGKDQRNEKIKDDILKSIFIYKNDKKLTEYFSQFHPSRFDGMPNKITVFVKDTSNDHAIRFYLESSTVRLHLNISHKEITSLPNTIK